MAKNEVARAQAADKAKEAAEGMRIAKRVDNLRELASKEEENLEKFRTSSLAAIMEDISRANREKESILSEVIALRDEKAAGFAKVHEAEQAVALERNSIQLREEVLEKKSSEVAIKEKEYRDTISATRNELERARKRGESVEELHQIAFKSREEAIVILSSARESEAKSLQSQRDIQEVISTKWHEVHEREASLTIRESSLNQNLEKISAIEAKFKATDDALKSREQNIVEKLEELALKNAEVSRNLQDSRDELDRARTHKEEAMKQRLKIDVERLEAQNALTEAEKAQKEAILAKERVLEGLIQRENAILAKEKELEQRNAENLRISEELENKTIRLSDRTKVRERILENLKH